MNISSSMDLDPSFKNLYMHIKKSESNFFKPPISFTPPTSFTPPISSTPPPSFIHSNSFTLCNLVLKDSSSYQLLLHDAIFQPFINYDMSKIILENGSKSFCHKFNTTELQQKITGIANKIWIETPESELTKQDDTLNKNLYITSKTLQSLLTYIFNSIESTDVFDIKKVRKKESNENTCVNLLSFFLSLRILKIFNNINAKLLNCALEEKNDKTYAKQIFVHLKKYYSNVNTPTALSTRKDSYKITADLFTYEARIKASRIRQKSLFELLTSSSEALIPFIKREIKKKCYENKNNITFNTVLKNIKRDYLVGQFPPEFVHDLIHVLKIQFPDFTFPKKTNGEANGAIFDPCAGWGAREVGALAHPDIGLYTGNDPNPHLTTAYNEIHKLYAPEKKVTILTKKIEDVTLQDLQQGQNLEYQLILTSPPYGVEHYYDEMTDYNKRDELMKMFHGILKSTQTLSYGGFMAINLGVTFFNLPELFKDLISEYPELQFISKTHLISNSISGMTVNKGNVNSSGKEFLILARKIAALGNPKAPLLTDHFSATKPLMIILEDSRRKSTTQHEENKQTLELMEIETLKKRKSTSDEENPNKKRKTSPKT